MSQLFSNHKRFWKGFGLKSSILLIIFAVFFSISSYVHAAVMSLSPASGQYTVGQTIAVNVMLSTPGEAANAMSGTIDFPQDKLQSVTISKAGSIVTFWAAEPTYANGEIHFEGVIPNPGYQGGAGKIITVYFKVIGQGTGSVIYTSASVLANDGQGTNILKSFTNAEFTFASAAVVPQPVPDEEPEKPKPQQPTTPVKKPEEVKPVEVATATPVTASIDVTPKKETSLFGDLRDFLLRTELSSSLLFLAILLVVILFALYTWYIVHRLKREMRLQVAKLDQDLHHAFHLLRDDVQEHVKTLEDALGKRNLTAEEEKFISYFKHNLRDTEKFLGKDVQRLKSRIK